MEDEVLLSRPTDRRLVNDDSSLPSGPPGAENDSYDVAQKDSSAQKKDSKPINRDPRRRSTSRDRRSRSRSRGKRRSRSRGRAYSPPPTGRMRYGNNRNRRSRDRTARSPPERNRSRDRINRRVDRSRSRDRYRNRRSRSRSNSPNQRRWSPMPKPPSPAMPPPPQYSVPQYETYGSYGNQYMGQFSGYDYSNQVQVQYPAAYPCDPQTWPQAPTAPQTAPPAPVPQVAAVENEEEQSKRDAAIAQEAQIQRDQLKKQRSDYLKRAAALKREMKILKDQRSDLVSTTAPPSPTTKGFVDENDRLQSQIQKKLSTIENVIDMLSSIIGEEKTTVSPDSQPGKKQTKKTKREDDGDRSSSSPERLKTKLIESMKSKRDNGKKSNENNVAIKVEKVKDEPTTKMQAESSTVPVKKINFSFYDPEMHWCITCDVFPKTAKDYLTHLHSDAHSKNSITQETPWHEKAVNDEFPSFPNAPTKRTPIRGLQFFVPSNGWYCKLCNFWMGDLHCASTHLKSRTHWDKYNKYTEQNPHFEVDWMADRQKILDGVRASEGCAPPPPQITPVVSTTGMDLLESIPLQINNQKVVNLDLDKKDKKKKKRDEKKEKRKKKRSKKRKKSSSSSSSSSSDSSSDSEKEKKPKEKEDRSNSIRVAMRKILNNDSSKDDLEASKLLTLSKLEEVKLAAKVAGTASVLLGAKKIADSNKKDELITQWNVPQPIISESEKKLLEDLKGKLKTKTATETQKPTSSESNDTKKRERSPSGKLNEANKSKMKRRSRSPAKRSSSVESVKRSNSKERRSASHDTKDRRSKSPEEVKGKSMGKKEQTDSQNLQKRSKSRDRSDKRSRSRDRRSKSRDRRSRSRGRRSIERDRRSRSRGRGNRNRNRRGRFSPDRRWRRSRSRRRSRSLKRSRSPRNSRSPKRGRRSRSGSPRYGRRRSGSRSRSRSRSRSYRIEKPIVRFPEFRPRVPPNEKKLAKKSENDAENKKTPPPKKPPTTQAVTGKKLPFIGRMPVFKKQNQGDDKKDDEQYDDSSYDPMTMGYDHYDPSHVVDYDDLMPDPMQYVTMMGAPPPPPSGPPPEDEKDMLPPGIDESEADTVPKPISDAPIPRKGPLPKDFQEALNIIFPGERRPDDGVKNSSETNGSQSKDESDSNSAVRQPNMEEESVDDNSLQTDDASQHSSGEAFLGFPSAPVSFSDITQDVPDIASLVAAAPPPPPPPPSNAEDDDSKNSKSEVAKPKSAKDNGSAGSPSEEEMRRQEELDDLAMLGIDADDLAAQCM